MSANRPVIQRPSGERDVSAETTMLPDGIAFTPPLSALPSNRCPLTERLRPQQQEHRDEEAFHLSNWEGRLKRRPSPLVAHLLFWCEVHLMALKSRPSPSQTLVRWRKERGRYLVDKIMTNLLFFASKIRQGLWKNHTRAAGSSAYRWCSASALDQGVGRRTQGVSETLFRRETTFWRDTTFFSLQIFEVFFVLCTVI